MIPNRASDRSTIMPDPGSQTLPEARFRALSEDSADATLVLDARGNVIYWSPSAERITGLPSDRILGTRVFDRVHPDDLEASVAAFGVMLSEPGDIGLDEFRFRNANGDWRRMEMSARNMLDHPAVRGMVLNARDVTHTRVLEEHYLRAQRYQVMSRVMHGLAHDVSNVLSECQTHVEVLAQLAKGESPAAEATETLAGLLRQAGTLTGDMISSSALDEEGSRSVSVEELLESVEQLFRTLVGEGYKLVVRTAGDPGSIRGDPAQLEQALLGLLFNARDASPAGGKILLVGATGTRPDEVSIAVQDSGVGIDPANLDRIFEPFYSTRESHAGLGLTLARDIVEQAGGRIEVDSVHGEGSTVHLHMPRVEPQTGQRRQDDAGAEMEETLSGARIVLVDSQAARRTLMGAALRQQGARVIELPPGTHLTTLIDYEAEGFDIVVAELLGPTITGGELVHALRKRGLATPVLFVCNGHEDDTREHLALNPDVPALQTPFGPSRLIEQVRSVWEHDVPTTSRISVTR